MEQARWDELDKLAADWTSWDPANGPAWLFLAEAAKQKGDYQRTADCLGKLADDDPRVIPALMERMRICFEHLNQPLDAVATCERILRIEPQASRAHSRLVFFYAMSLQRQQLVRCLRRAIEARSEPPEAYVYLFGADWLYFSNALAINRHWLESHPDEEAFLVAQALLVASAAAGEPIDPLDPNSPIGGDETLIKECLERFPENIEVLAYYLQKEADAGNLQPLAEMLSRAPAAAEKDNRFWRCKGIYHAERGELDPAIDAFQHALDCQPYDWRARHRLATSLRLSGKPQEAERQTQLALLGKQIEKEIKDLPSVDEASGDLLSRLAAYAAASGDRLVEEALQFRLSP
jgi:tetratricopeptide (TPR) repeat protein